MVTEAQGREIASKLVSGVYSAFEPNNLAPETVLLTTTLCCLGNNTAPIGQELAEWTVKYHKGTWSDPRKDFLYATAACTRDKMYNTINIINSAICCI